MVLESTIICIDNSEFMRNGDFLPTRLQAQQDAVNIVCHSKTRSNPENNVGLLTLANCEMLVTLTTDSGRVLSRLHQVQPQGYINIVSGVRVAHLALKHRQGKNHKMRIIVFVGSPIETDEKELIKLAKRLKKEKVNVDVVNFGEDAANLDKLAAFLHGINGKEGTGSHLVTVPPGPHLSEALMTSPIMQGENGAGGGVGGLPGTSGYEFGVDPNEDPELALALRVSMEEQRARQEAESRAAASSKPQSTNATSSVAADTVGTDEEMLERALASSLQTGTVSREPDFATMTEEEQIEYAMQMSLQAPLDDNDKVEDMETDNAEGGEDDLVQDAEFLQSVLQGLPGVDPNSDAIRTTVANLQNQNKDKDKDQQKDKK